MKVQLLHQPPRIRRRTGSADRTGTQYLSEVVVDAVRADLLSLCWSIHAVHPGLWQQHLLTEPPHTRNRALYANRLLPSLRQQIVAELARTEGSNLETADALLTTLLEHGLAGFVDRHLADGSGTSDITAALARALTPARHMSAGIDPDAQAEIERLVPLLLDALETAGIPLSIEPFLSKQPSTYRRITWGRRLRFGVPTINRRRQQRRSRRRSGKSGANYHHPPRRSEAETTLVTSFARLSGLTPKEAEDRLRNVVTYGVLGLLPKGNWETLIDARLLSWLRLMRFGHVPNAVLWPEIYHGAERLCAEI